MWKGAPLTYSHLYAQMVTCALWIGQTQWHEEQEIRLTHTHTHTDANTQNRWRNRLVQYFNIQNCPGKSSNQTITNWLLKKRKNIQAHLGTHSYAHIYTQSQDARSPLQTSYMLLASPSTLVSLWQENKSKTRGAGTRGEGEQEEEEEPRKSTLGPCRSINLILLLWAVRWGGQTDGRQHQKKRKKSKREHWLKSLSRPLVVQPEAR